MWFLISELKPRGPAAATAQDLHRSPFPPPLPEPAAQRSQRHRSPQQLLEGHMEFLMDKNMKWTASTWLFPRIYTFDSCMFIIVHICSYYKSWIWSFKNDFDHENLHLAIVHKSHPNFIAKDLPVEWSQRHPTRHQLLGVAAWHPPAVGSHSAVPVGSWTHAAARRDSPGLAARTKSKPKPGDRQRLQPHLRVAKGPGERLHFEGAWRVRQKNMGFKKTALYLLGVLVHLHLNLTFCTLLHYIAW